MRRQVRVTPYPHEPAGWIVENTGPEVAMFSSDYPHVEGGRHPMRRFEASLAGARIAIDPGHGPDDPGRVAPGGLTEAEAAMAIGRTLAEELRRRGAIPTLLRGPDATPAVGTTYPSPHARTPNSIRPLRRTCPL